MGRPIKKKFFGNTNLGSASTSADNAIGGEGISSSIAIDNTGSNYSQGAVLTFSDPQLPTGVVATGSPTTASPGAGGGITAVTLTEGGSGYTSTATISVTKPANVTPTATAVSGNFTLTSVSSVAGIYVGMRLDGSPGVQASTYVSSVGTTTVTLTKTMTASTSSNTYTFSDQGSGFKAKTALTASQQNALSVTAYLTTGSSALAADIIKQEASHRYLVRNSEGVGQCKLVSTSTLAAGQMYITATDSLGGTYCVTKLTARRAVLTRAGGTSFEFATNSVAGWTTGSASTGVVSIANS